MPLNMGGAVRATGTSPIRDWVPRRGPADGDQRWDAASMVRWVSPAADQNRGRWIRSDENCEYEKESWS